MSFDWAAVEVRFESTRIRIITPVHTFGIETQAPLDLVALARAERRAFDLLAHVVAAECEVVDRPDVREARHLHLCTCIRTVLYIERRTAQDVKLKSTSTQTTKLNLISCSIHTVYSQRMKCFKYTRLLYTTVIMYSVKFNTVQYL